MTTEERRLHLLNKVIAATRMYPGLSFTSLGYGVEDSYDAINFTLGGALFCAVHHYDGRVSVSLLKDTPNSQARGVRASTSHLRSVVEGVLLSHLEDKEAATS